MIKIKSRTESTNRIEKFANDRWYCIDDNMTLDFSSINYTGRVLMVETPLGRFSTKFDKLVNPTLSEQEKRFETIGIMPTHFDSLEEAVSAVLCSVDGCRKVRFRGRHSELPNGEYVLAALEIYLSRENGKIASVMIVPSHDFGVSMKEFCGGQFPHCCPTLKKNHQYSVQSMEIWAFADEFGKERHDFTITITDCPTCDSTHKEKAVGRTLKEVLEALFAITSARTVEFDRKELRPDELVMTCRGNGMTTEVVVSGDVDFHAFWRW